MKKHWILFISLAFNIAFIGMFFYHNMLKPPHPEPRPPREMKQFLEKHPTFESTFRSIHKHREEFNHQKMHFIHTIYQNEDSKKAMEDQLNLLLEKQIEMEREIGLMMIELGQVLSDEELRNLPFFRNIHPPEQPFRHPRKEKIKNLMKRRKQ